jgi:ABC-type multidrug transport system fused ATPase/permease subunit
MFVIKPSWPLSLAPVPFVVLIADRYGRRSRPALQEVQQQIAELTAEAEENISGVRVVKAFAREDRQLERFRDLRRAACSPVDLRQPDPGPVTRPMISFLPNLGLAAILLVGGREVIDGTLTLGSSPPSTPTC